MPPKPPPISEAVTRSLELGADVTDHVMALGAAPELPLPVAADAGEAGVGLDIALVGGLGLVFALQNDVGLGEALLHVAMAELMALGHIGGPGRRGHEAAAHRLAALGRGFGLAAFLDMADLLGRIGGGRVVGRRLEPLGHHGLVEQRRIGAHRLLHIGDMG